MCLQVYIEIHSYRNHHLQRQYAFHCDTVTKQNERESASVYRTTQIKTCTVLRGFSTAAYEIKSLTSANKGYTHDV